MSILMGAVRSPDSTAAYTFVGIAAIVVLARLAGSLMRRLRQPAVIGEIVVGILLGPSLLGAFPGHLSTRLFPLDVRPYLSNVSQLGLLIFMFLVGLEVDTKLLRGRARLAATVSLSSIALPFALGIAVAVALHSNHHLVVLNGRPHNVHLTPFALFIGASMSVTAFPVLARILSERGLFRIPVGAITLACAAVDDVAAWTLLALVLAIVQGGGTGHVILVVVEAAAFCAGMLLVVRPALARVVAHYRRDQGIAPELMVIVLTGILLSGWATAEIGIHQIFGAFLFGVVMPREGQSRFVADVVDRLESVALMLLLPVYFVITGFSVNVRQISLRGLGELGLILVAAVGGKFLGATLGARLNGLPGRRAATVGVLMNTRGLTELVILNVGLSVGVLDTHLFTLLVLMAIITTVMTEPLLRLTYPPKLLAADLADLERAETGRGGYRVLVYLADLGADVGALEAAAGIAAADPGAVVNASYFMVRRRERVAGMAGELAEMADALDRLNRLCAAHVGERVRPATLFTDAPVRELRDQVSRLDIDCLVIGPGADAMAAELLADPPADVVVVGASPAGARVVGCAGEGDDAAAVVEVAARLAVGRQAPLTLTSTSRATQRRLAQAAERLRSLLPSPVEVVSTLDDVDGAARSMLVVSDAAGACPGAALRVCSGQDLARIGWDERVSRVATPGLSSTGAAS